MLVLNCMRRSLGLYASLVVVTITNIAFGAQFEEAKVTAVVHDVKLLRGEAVLRAATVNDEIRADTAVRTGLESRSELTFPDLTLARLGANTIFRFNQKAREVNLINGAILLRVPKNSGGATITTDAVTAGIVGTTVMMEYHPRGIAKFIVLEGVARLYLKKRVGESILVHAGEMMIVRWGATELSEPVAVDISEIMRTSLLITGFGPLPSAPLIATTETDQIQRESQGQLVETNLVIYGSGTLVTVADETDQRFAALPVSNPEFGKPETIRTPDPFPIANTTRIKTDPTIVDGNITVSGKIYRGPGDDGPLSQYLFGSTSAFDAALKLNRFFKDPANLPVAFFKFQHLAILGNPTVTLGQNDVTKLGLIGVNGIISGAPGGNLTFNGLDLLFLATKAGSIDLTSDLSFQNLSTLGVYARGAGSNLTLASSISGVTKLILAAENDVQISGQTAATNINVLSDVTVDAGGDLDSSGLLAFTVPNSGRISDTGANISLTAGGSISSRDLGLLIANDNGGQIATGGNISVMSSGDLTTKGGNVTFTIENAAGRIGNGGNISLAANRNLSTQALQLLVSNFDPAQPAGHIGDGGNISLTTGASLSANSIDAIIDNRGAAMIDSGGSMTFNVGGTLTTTGDAGFTIFTRFDNSNGSTVGPQISSDVNLTISAARVAIGGDMASPSLRGELGVFSGISNRSATINGNASYIWDVSGDTNIGGGAAMQILNDGGTELPSLQGGTGGRLHGNATVQVSSANFTASSIFDRINNNNGGVIDGTARITLNVADNIAVESNASFLISNQQGPNSTARGSIASDAILDLNATNISVGGQLSAQINGTVENPDFIAGIIGGNAVIDVNAVNVDAGSLLAGIGTSNDGRIAGAAAINLNISGNSTATGDATFQILGSNGDGSASININGGNYNVGGTFLGFIDGNGIFTVNRATIAADVVRVGVFGNNGTLRIGGGSISANTLLHLYAPGSNGTIDFVSNVTLSTSNAIPAIVANTVTIENGVVVTVNATADGVPFPADVFTNVPNYTGSGGNGSTTGTFAGTGAATQPFGQRPPFVTTRGSSNAVALDATVAQSPEAGSLPALGSGHPHSGPRARHRSSANRPTFCVIDTSQLQSVLDNAAPAINGKLHISSTKTARKVSVRTPAGTVPRRKNIARSVDSKAPSPVLALNAR